MSVKKYKPTITIGIPAYNEEKNITRLLSSILEQKTDNFILKRIMIYSDGSTDRTNALIKKIRRKNITLIEGKIRKGQAFRMNQIIKKFDTDILVFLDADILLATPQTLNYLIKPFVKRSTIALVGGGTFPYPGKTFTAQAVAVTFNAYAEIREKLRGGNNIFGCSGHILALSKHFAKRTHIPEYVYANDAYLYFSCLKQGGIFKHVKSAKVWHKTPTNLKDQIKQNSRFVSSPYQLADNFGEIVFREYSIPKLFFLKTTIKQCIKKPVHSVYIFLVNAYCKLHAKKTKEQLTGVWNIATSTKEGF